jgi:hypothetical protein
MARAFLLALVAIRAGVAGGAPPAPPQSGAERIATVAADEFWKQLKDRGLLPARNHSSFWRPLPAAAGRDAPGRAGVLAALEAALAAGDLAAGPHVDLLDYEGTLVLGEPQIHSVHGFRNQHFDVWFLLSKTFSGDWEQWALVQDKRVEPNLASFFHYERGQPVLSDAANDCCRCHANGPRAIAPARPDLVSGAEYIAEINDHCAGLVGVATDFDGRRPDFGPELALAECAGCHATGADRGPLHRVQAPAIRAAIARGRMPPDGPLSREASLALEHWLDDKPAGHDH